VAAVESAYRIGAYIWTWAGGPTTNAGVTILTGAIERVVLVLAASVVLALGVSGLAHAAFPLTLGEGSQLALRSIGLTIAVSAALALLIHRRRRSPDGASADPVASTIVATLMMMAMFAMLSVLPPLLGTGESTPGAPPPEAPSRAGADRSAVDPPMESLGGLVRANPQDRPEAEATPVGPPAAPFQPPQEGGAALTILQIGIVLLAFLILAIGLFEAIRRALARRRMEPLEVEMPPEEPDAAKEFEEAMRKSVAELADDRPNPGNQVTSAYYRLLAVLDEVGFPRRRQEAPHEHLHRALVRLGVSPAPMRRLTELYVFAEFGRGQIGPAHRRAASEALEVSLKSLRKRHPRLDP